LKPLLDFKHPFETPVEFLSTLLKPLLNVACPVEIQLAGAGGAGAVLPVPSLQELLAHPAWSQGAQSEHVRRKPHIPLTPYAT
jgi:hypothetical protein